MAVNKLTIAVPPQWLEHPQVKALAEKGHEIVPIDVSKFHLLLAPQAHRWNDLMWDFLPAALTAGRRTKKEGVTL